MKHLLFTLAFLCSGMAAFAQQRISPITADALNQRMKAGGDTVYVVNFWATWCAPCVKELPEFGKLQQQYAGRPVKVILVSLDFKESYPEKLSAYVAKKGIRPEVRWFSETDANVFIPKIDAAWSGALPGTLVACANKQMHTFLEKTVTAAELGKLVEKCL